MNKLAAFAGSVGIDLNDEQISAYNLYYRLRFEANKNLNCNSKLNYFC